MLNSDQIEHFRDNGYVLGSKVLSDTQVDELRSELERVIALREDSPDPKPVRLVNLAKDEGSIVWQIVDIWMASDAFKELAHNTLIAEEAAQLTGASELRVWHDQIQYKVATKGGVNMWHQDSPYWGNITPKDEQITAWIALDDVDEGNGCMSMVPGSHRWGNQIEFIHTIESYDRMPDSFEDHALTTRLCPVKKGYVHFHHSLTWHGSHANTSDRPRRAIAVHLMTEKTLFDGSGSHIMRKYIDVADGEQIVGDAFPLVWKRS